MTMATHTSFMPLPEAEPVSKSILVVNKMSRDGTRILDDGVLVFDGHEKHPTVEGPKFYKVNGYYYISAPAGGVATGWQLILRSKNIYGPIR
jgi:beta-xylosidase